jgi:hypothetical protein
LRTTWPPLCSSDTPTTSSEQPARGKWPAPWASAGGGRLAGAAQPAPRAVQITAPTCAADLSPCSLPLCSLTRVGAMVLLCHEANDIFMELAKMARYADHQPAANAAFAGAHLHVGWKDGLGAGAWTWPGAAWGLHLAWHWLGSSLDSLAEPRGHDPLHAPAVFTLSWFATRVTIFPLYVIRSCLFESQASARPPACRLRPGRGASRR